MSTQTPLHPQLPRPYIQNFDNIFGVAVPAGRGFLSIDEVSVFLGLSAGTIRHMLTMNRFPIPTVLIGGRRMVPIPKLREFMNKVMGGEQPGPAEHDPVPPPPIGKRGRGRPRKIRTDVSAGGAV